MLDRLPFDVLFSVLEHLEVQDLVRTARVSHYFFAALQYRTVWKTAYAHTTLARPPGPCVGQSLDDLRSTLCMSARVERRWPPASARQNPRVRSLPIESTNIFCAVVFGRWLLVAGRDRVDCYDHDMKQAGDGGQPAYEPPLGSHIRFFKCFDAKAEGGEQVAYAVCEEELTGDQGWIGGQPISTRAATRIRILRMRPSKSPLTSPILFEPLLEMRDENVLKGFSEVTLKGENLLIRKHDGDATGQQLMDSIWVINLRTHQVLKPLLSDDEFDARYASLRVALTSHYLLVIRYPRMRSSMLIISADIVEAFPLHRLGDDDASAVHPLLPSHKARLETWASYHYPSVDTMDWSVEQTDTRTQETTIAFPAMVSRQLRMLRFTLHAKVSGAATAAISDGTDLGSISFAMDKLDGFPNLPSDSSYRVMLNPTLLGRSRMLVFGTKSASCLIPRCARPWPTQVLEGYTLDVDGANVKIIEKGERACYESLPSFEKVIGFDPTSGRMFAVSGLPAMGTRSVIRKEWVLNVVDFA